MTVVKYPVGGTVSNNAAQRNSSVARQKTVGGEVVPGAQEQITYNPDGTLATVTSANKVDTYNYTSGALTSITRVAGGITYTQTLTYSGGVVSAISDWA